MPVCETCGANLPAHGSVCPDCATRKVAVPQDFPEIPGYRVLRRLGEGGMGEVFLGEDVELGRRVAVKLISKRVASDATLTARFLREARLLATIEHPHVVRVYSFGRTEERPYLVMEYVEGQSLGELIRNKGPLPLTEALRILREAIEGLQAAHELNIIHRDIKPANILLDRRGGVRVADFGLAKRSSSGPADGDSAITQSGYFVGSPHYLAPEQAQGEPTDFRSDVYSLGVVLYEMLTGERPFTGATPVAVLAKHLHDPLPALAKRRPELSSDVSHLLNWMTAKDRQQRPASYAELVAEVDRLWHGDATVSSPKRRPASLMPAAVAILILVALAVLWWFQNSNSAEPSNAPPAADTRLTIAVTPFYGPDSESEREGRVMAALVERSIISRLGRDEVRLLGIDETKQPVRSHEDARALAGRLGAHVVIWGETLAFRGETEVQPYLTVVGLAAAEVEADAAPVVSAPRGRELEELSESNAGTVRLPAEAPNQIELRKTSAEGVGQMAAFLAGIYALHREHDAAKALRLFDQSAPSPDLLTQRAQAHVMREETTAAAELLAQVVAADPAAGEVRAQLADLLMQAGERERAIGHYRYLAESGKFLPTRNAVLFEGRLFVREQFQSPAIGDGKQRDTGNVLMIDSATGTVQKRYPMPGFVTRFVPSEDHLSIEYKTRESGSYAQKGTVEYTAGAFRRPLSRGGNLLMRMNALKSGWVLAGNFMDEAYGVISDRPPVARFRPSTAPKDASVPNTFPELESALRSAMRSDPTQPWHLFFLGQTLWATGRADEAEEIWRQMLTQRFEGIGYNEWAYMARLFRHFQQEEWARTAERLSERLRISDVQPVHITTLIERLINQQNVRLHPGWRLDDGQRLEILRRARRTTGLSETDHLAAAAWRAELSRRGDRRGAAEEDAWYRRAIRDPLNDAAVAVYVDYAVYALLSVSLALMALIVIAFERAIPARKPISWRALLRSSRARILSSPYRAVLTAGLIAVAASLSVAVFLMVEARNAAPGIVAVVAVFILAIATTPWRRAFTWGRAIASINRRERAVIVFLTASTIAGLLLASRLLTTLEAVHSIPVGMADSFGHIDVIRPFEESQKRADSREVRYALAVANHLAGEWSRAESLYRSVADDPRAARALANVRRQDRHVELPAAGEIVRALRKPRFLMTPGEVRNFAIDAAAFIMALCWFAAAAGVLLSLSFFVLRPSVRSRDQEQKPSRTSAVAEMILPSLRDYRRGAPILAGLQLLALSFIVSVLILSRGVRIVGAPGLFSSNAIPNVFFSSPFPSEGYVYKGNGSWAWDFWTMLFAHPHARIFWGVVVTLAAVLLALHARTVFATWREWREKRASHYETLEVEPS